MEVLLLGSILKKRYSEILPRLRNLALLPNNYSQQLFLYEHFHNQIRELVPALEEFERASKWLLSKDGKFGESFFQ
jgi:hypothetical protein